MTPGNSSMIRILFGLLVVSFVSFSCSEKDMGDTNGKGEVLPPDTPPLKTANNPIIPDIGVCDPHVHIFDGKAYLFATHDRMPGHNSYGMYDWWIWSSEDLVEWKLEFNLFPLQMWTGPTKNCWATDGAERNGKYYFYVSGNWQLGVAVSENGPGGPYVDALGKGMDIGYDPTVFIDDDPAKTPYLVIGKYPYKIARLNEDMVSLAEEPKDLLHAGEGWDGDGGFLHKHNGIYYLNGHGPHYSTSENLYGPYTYRGTAYKHWVDHPTFFTWHNQTYCAFGLSDTDKFFRKTHMTYVHYKENGEMYICGETGDSFVGVGQYDCSEKIQAENYFAASDNVRKKEDGTGFAVSGMEDGDYLYFQRILNLAEDSDLIVSLKSGAGSGVLEFRNGSPDGELMGTLDVSDTGGAFKGFETVLENKVGLNNVCVVYRGDGEVEIDWLRFMPAYDVVAPPAGDPVIVQHEPDEDTVPLDAYSVIEAENLMCYYELQSTAAGDPEDNGGNMCLGFLKNGSHFSYLLDFGTESDEIAKFRIRVACPVSEASLEMREDAPDGRLIKSFSIGRTGGWNNWETQEFSTYVPEGVSHVFFVVKGSGEDYQMNINWLGFSR